MQTWRSGEPLDLVDHPASQRHCLLADGTDLLCVGALLCPGPTAGWLATVSTASSKTMSCMSGHHVSHALIGSTGDFMQCFMVEPRVLQGRTASFCDPIAGKLIRPLKLRSSPDYEYACINLYD